MKIRIIFLLLIFSKAISFAQTINGKVVNVYTGKPIKGACVYLVWPQKTEDSLNVCYWSSNVYKIIQSAETNSLGKYSFRNLNFGTYTIVINKYIKDFERFGDGIFISAGIDSCIKLNNRKSHFKKIEIEDECPFDKTRNQTFCPKCKNEDKVVMVIHGLPLIDSTGINGQPMENFHFAGCIVDSYCKSNRYCNRCKLEF